MKRIDRLIDAIGMADDSYIDAAMTAPTAKPRHLWMHRTATAACILLICALGLTVLPRLAGLVGSDSAAPESSHEAASNNPLADQAAYGDCISPPSDGGPVPLPPEQYGSANSLSVRERISADVIYAQNAIVWPWEDLTNLERYTCMDRGDVQYRTRGAVISEMFIGAKRIGGITLTAADSITGDIHTANAAVYDVRGIANELLQAVRIDGDDNYYLFAKDTYDPPATLGEMIQQYSADVYMPLSLFRMTSPEFTETPPEMLLEGGSDAIWQILSEVSDAPFVEYTFRDAEAVVFSVSSEPLGITNRSFAVYADGYLQTNAFDWGYAFAIGEDAARSIIEYTSRHSKSAPNPQQHTLVGTVTEIQPYANGGYLMTVDDTVMMVNPEDGVSFTVDMSAPHLSRYLKNGIIGIGDLVAVKYSDSLSEENRHISGAEAIYEAILVPQNDVIIPE